MKAKKVAVIGGGPVGLFASLLLQNSNIDFMCFQKTQKLRAHPSAHWVSARSKSLLSQIPNLCQKIDLNQQNFNNFKYYNYCLSLGGDIFGRKNQFYPSIQQKLKNSHNKFNQYPSHISQHKLLALEYDCLLQKQNIVFGEQISKIQKQNQQYLLINQKNQAVCSAKYVIIANGYNSTIRDSLNFIWGVKHEFYKLINIHFKCKKLGDIIKDKNIQAMLYFIYNSKIPSVIVNHSLQQGEFVIQIPNYEPFVDLLQVYSPKQLIQISIDPQIFIKIQSQIQIIHVGRWKLQGHSAIEMHKENIFIVGDSAHTYTPAGGFGMNCGFQDVNQLIHTLSLLQNNPKINKQKVINLFQQSRIKTNQKYLQKSLSNYQLTQKTASQLGFPASLTNYFFNFTRNIPKIPFSFLNSASQNIRLLAMNALFKPSKIHSQLQLFFDQFDLSVQKTSKKHAQIIKKFKQKKHYDIFVNKNTEKHHILNIFGEIQDKNICTMQLPQDQKIVKNDGIVIL